MSPMVDNEINSLKTDIALIQKDIKQIEYVFTKIDSAVGQMSEILKTIAVQENILENNEKRVTTLEETIKKHNDEEVQFRKELTTKFDDMKETSQKERERHHRELLDSIENMNRNMSEKLETQENWRWYILGIGAVLLFIINKLPWAIFFG
jgi:DNA repair ATPase RecN